MPITPAEPEVVALPVYFTQSITVKRTGFTNGVKVEIGDPVIDLESFDAAMRAAYGDGYAVRSIDGQDITPRMAGSGGSGHPSGIELPDGSGAPLDSCTVSLVKSGQGIVAIYAKDLNATPSYWNSTYEPRAFESSVPYDSMELFSYSCMRMVFSYVDATLEDGRNVQVADVAALPKDGGQSVWFRQQGQTDSWGSEGQKTLFVPWQDGKDW